MSCDAVIRSMVARLSPKLHEQINQGLTDTLAESIQTKICEVIDIYVRKIDARLKSLAQYSPVTVEQKSITSQLILDTTLSDEVALSNGFLDLPLKGDFIAPDDPVRTPFFPSPISKSDADTDRMIYVYVSDYVINSFFYQLDRLGNFRINLHAIPEVKQMLSLNCDQTNGGGAAAEGAQARSCLGSILANPEQYTDGKGRLEARVRSPPVVVLNDVGAHIGLNLSVDLSYKEADEDEQVKAVLMTVNVKLQLYAKHLSIRNVSPKHEHQQLRINTTISITHLEVTSAMAYVDSMNDFAMNLPQFLEERKSLIEEIVRKNLHVVIPLSVNDELIGVNSVYGEFRSRTLVLGFDVDLHEKLFEHFSLMNSNTR
ncbi:unnamed protein product [Anisakis simplex]|uniref:BPI2 domain-containing protein n=1 Tax=Anisakis simplex TaxID=6269 RepID=A0A0M3J145_ANISI|nr:unnamed protein product [Anisakis simplex]